MMNVRLKLFLINWAGIVGGTIAVAIAIALVVWGLAWLGMPYLIALGLIFLVVSAILAFVLF